MSENNFQPVIRPHSQLTKPYPEGKDSNSFLPSNGRSENWASPISSATLPAAFSTINKQVRSKWPNLEKKVQFHADVDTDRIITPHRAIIITVEDHPSSGCAVRGSAVWSRSISRPSVPTFSSVCRPRLVPTPTHRHQGGRRQEPGTGNILIPGYKDKVFNFKSKSKMQRSGSGYTVFHLDIRVWGQW